eukprot:scaffold502142_cov45-Prasinocladus_malaysianus.AAC.2
MGIAISDIEYIWLAATNVPRKIAVSSSGASATVSSASDNLRWLPCRASCRGCFRVYERGK